MALETILGAVIGGIPSAGVATETHYSQPIGRCFVRTLMPTWEVGDTVLVKPDLDDMDLGLAPTAPNFLTSKSELLCRLPDADWLSSELYYWLLWMPIVILFPCLCSPQFGNSPLEAVQNCVFLSRRGVLCS